MSNIQGTEFCEKCPHYNGCDYIKANRKDLCGFLGYYLEGYETAINKAEQWYRENLLSLHSRHFREKVIDDFKKFMAGQSYL